MDSIISIATIIGALFTLGCCLVLACDIIATIRSQFKGDSYEWTTIKLLKQKRVWWQWALIAALLVFGVYSLLPDSLVGKEDFRADREQPEYTAYYACEYDIRHFGKGNGYVEITKENGEYTISKIYTSSGIVLVDHLLTEDDDLKYSIRLSFCSDGDSSIKVKDGPVGEDAFSTMKQSVVFGYPDPTKSYCSPCRGCGRGYYSCVDASAYLCPDCTYKCKTGCAYCGEKCPPWPGLKDGFVVCEDCLAKGFADKNIRYYFWNN